MHDGVNTPQERRQLAGVRNISHDQLEALGERGVACNQIVINDGFIAAALERQRGVAADITCSSDH